MSITPNIRCAVPALACAAMLMFPSAISRADQDDIVNNADLQPSAEELARRTVLKRWPDAGEIDIAELEPEDNETDNAEKNGIESHVGKKTDKADKIEKSGINNEKATIEEGQDAAIQGEKDPTDPDDKDWSVSVLFISGGHNFEAMLDDNGKICCVHEDLPVEKAPHNIVDAAQKAVHEKDTEVIYVDKVTDETKTPAVATYLVGVGMKEVKVNAEGKVLKIEDIPDDEDEEGADGAGEKAADNKDVI